MSTAKRFETVRAKIGATLLDLLKPGWAEEINVETLKLDSCESCILGQLFGGYARGAEKVFAMRVTNPTPDGQSFYIHRNPQVTTACEEAGFVVPDSIGVQLTKSYKNLTAAWKREISKRVKVATVNV